MHYKIQPVLPYSPFLQWASGAVPAKINLSKKSPFQHFISVPQTEIRCGILISLITMQSKN